MLSENFPESTKISEFARIYNRGEQRGGRRGSNLLISDFLFLSFGETNGDIESNKKKKKSRIPAAHVDNTSLIRRGGPHFVTYFDQE